MQLPPLPSGEGTCGCHTSRREKGDAVVTSPVGRRDMQLSPLPSGEARCSCHLSRERAELSSGFFDLRERLGHGAIKKRRR